MNNPKVVWCNRTDCYYYDGSTCGKYNISINEQGCSDYSDGRLERKYNRGTKEEIYKRDEARAFDEWLDAMH